MTLPFALLQIWHELDFNLGRPEDIEVFPWSAPVALTILAFLLFFLYKGRRNYKAFPELTVVSGETTPTVTVVIPARNEAGSIGACISSFPGTHVIVVDDASSDNTVSAARAAGAEVVAAPPVPQGAMGKPNAMVAGERIATGNYVLFTEARARFEPQFLPAAAHYADSNQCVLLSAFLKQEYGSFFEHMLIPYAMGLYFSGVSAKRVQNPIATETLANGACMLFLRSAHEFFGGYQSVQVSQIDDIAIAQKVKRHRMKLQIVRAEKLGRIRMYDSLGSIRRGIRRRAFRLMRTNKAAAAQMVFTSLLLTAIPPVAVWLVHQEQWPFVPFLLLGPVILFRPWYSSLWKALLYLPAIYVFQWLAFEGVVAGVFGLKTTWKGRKV